MKYLEFSRLCLPCWGKGREFQGTLTIELPGREPESEWGAAFFGSVSLSEKRFSNLSMNYSHPQGLLKQISEPYSRVSDWEGLGQGLTRIPSWCFFCWSGVHIVNQFYGIYSVPRMGWNWSRVSLQVQTARFDRLKYYMKDGKCFRWSCFINLYNKACKIKATKFSQIYIAQKQDCTM